MSQNYDEIGGGYAQARCADPRIATHILRALGDATTIVNVGAGSGSYEPAGRSVIAVEPARKMIQQRPTGSASVVQASAMQLPFLNNAFSAALAVLTVHHWPDRERGLAELARVARDTIVILTWDPDSPGFWLVQDYLPELAEIDRKIFPSMAEIGSVLGPIEINPVPIPHDCTDGFLGAYWRRPHAYLDRRRQRGISTFARVIGLDGKLARLRADLEDGTWQNRHADLLNQTELDIGYRIVTSKTPAAGYN